MALPLLAGRGGEGEWQDAAPSSAHREGCSISLMPVVPLSLLLRPPWWCLFRHGGGVCFHLPESFVGASLRRLAPSSQPDQMV
jgi:hypothetical protein